ncbi:CHAT domain-containing protein [Streptomyces sp. NPDC056501]|uniref:CHAT domain-containing protein n=1 Tax=Streptomyces sp. NPDC056501 TaxID=3345841 RepID=UPI0036932A30
MTAAATRPAEPPEGADPEELIDVAQKLLEHHDEQELPEEAARSLWRCRDVLLRARGALERQGARADPYQLASARYLYGLTLSVGYWQAATGQAEAYGVDDPHALRREATPLLALSRALLPDDDPVHAHASIRLALLLHDRHESPDEGAEESPDATPPGDADGEPDAGPDDLDEALAAFEEGLRLIDEEPHPGFLVTYGCALADRYDRDGDSADLLTAAALLEELLYAMRPRGEADRADGADSLHRADSVGWAADSVDWSASDSRSASDNWADSLDPAGSVDWAGSVDRAESAGEADQLEIETRVRLIRLLQASDAPGDDERAAHHLELLAATAPDDHPSRIFAAGHLVDVYQERGGGRVRPEDRPARLARLRDLHRLIDPEDADHARATALLGSALAERVEPAARPEPAEGAVRDGSGSGSGSGSGTGTGTGTGSGTGEADTGPTENHHEAVELLRAALEGLSAEDPLRASGHAALGTLLNSLHDYEPARYEVAEAAFHLERAVELHPDDGPLRSELINHLAHANLADDRSVRRLEHIDRTIELLNESMSTPSDTPSFRSQAHGAYAAALSQRHALSHSSDDLDASIRHLTAAFRQTPPSDVNRVVYLQNLGVGLYQRYLAGGDLQDLHAAHRYLSEVAGAVTGGTTVYTDRRLIGRDRTILEHGLAQLQFMLASVARDTPGMAAAVAAMRRVRNSLDPDDPQRLTIDVDFGLSLFVQAYFNGDPRDRLDGLVIMLESVEVLPEEHPDRPRLLLRVAGALMVSSFTPYNAGGIASADRLLRETLAAVSPDSPEGMRATVLLAALLFNRFRYTGVPAHVDESVEIAVEGLERIRQRAPSPVSTFLGYVLADALRARASAGHDTRDGRDGVTRAGPASASVPAPAPDGASAPAPVPDDARAAREAGIAALREAASVVLLQAAAEAALQMARTASDRALQIARWCLADGDLRGALEALELGRGQVLHAATTTSDLPALLREAGRADLAAEWDEGPVVAGVAGVVADLGTLLEGSDSLLGTLAEGMEPPLPDDLRQRALTALARSGAGTALTTPPTPEEIGTTLRAAGADALVYLLPPGGAELLPADAGSGGVAVVVTRDGEVGTVALGLLRRRGLDVLTAYREAHRERQTALEAAAAATSASVDGPDGPDGRTDAADAADAADRARKAAHARWSTALAELCDWAGPVVMAPLLRSPLIRAAGPEPHLVLVPFGELGGIPWHAAVLSSGLRHGGRPVRAVERTVLSYAASARQLQVVTRRPRLPLKASPVIVGNPDESLPGAATEARQIHAAIYREGLLLGRVRGAKGPGTPAEVLSALPGRERAGASVLHLACHAWPSAVSPLDACLALAGPHEGRAAPLSVRVILEQARGRPAEAPGGLVVLDACVSDHLAGDFDESLTLSTAFLAAGATGVVGSRWEVEDGPTGLIMYVFHDRLRHGVPLARALRETQLWLLDPDRRLPDGMPRAVADILHDADPAAPELWAAFVCQGH